MIFETYPFMSMLSTKVYAHFIYKTSYFQHNVDIYDKKSVCAYAESMKEAYTDTKNFMSSDSLLGLFVRQCQSCGAPLYDGSNVCGSCGAGQQ